MPLWQYLKGELLVWHTYHIMIACTNTNYDYVQMQNKWDTNEQMALGLHKQSALGFTRNPDKGISQRIESTTVQLERR